MAIRDLIQQRITILGKQIIEIGFQMLEEKEKHSLLESEEEDITFMLGTASIMNNHLMLLLQQSDEQLDSHSDNVLFSLNDAKELEKELTKLLLCF